MLVSFHFLSFSFFIFGVGFSSNFSSIYSFIRIYVVGIRDKLPLLHSWLVFFLAFQTMYGAQTMPYIKSVWLKSTNGGKIHTKSCDWTKEKKKRLRSGKVLKKRNTRSHENRFKIGDILVFRQSGKRNKQTSERKEKYTATRTR